MNKYLPTSDNVKHLGRTCMTDGTLWLAHSGSGAAFSFCGTGARITILGDSSVLTPGNETNYARIAVFVNGARVLDELIDVPQKELSFYEDGDPKDLNVEIVKLSESLMSTAGIGEICLDTQNGIRPAEEKPRLIEFIGDSITCGYGVEDENREHDFRTATEDVTKAYAYLTARALDADYSMVSYSGFGIISGYVNEGEPRQPERTLPLYYDRFGLSCGTYLNRFPQKTTWDFTRKPDLIVINVGTNDDSYTLDFADRQEDFCRAYTEFLKQVRRFNADAVILCTLGIMGDRLFPMVKKAACAYTDTTGDNNISCMKFDEQLPEDGLSANWHPTAATYVKAARRLTLFIRDLMGWDQP